MTVSAPHPFWPACLGRAGIAACFVLGALTAPSAALAADPGVHVDPNSPAGKEYAVPLQQARDIGGSRTSPELFGAGITPSVRVAQASGGRGPSRASNTQRKRPGTTTAATVTSAPADGGAAQLHARGTVADSGGPSALWFELAAAALVVLAAV